jgi:hypothetical protein
MPVYLFFIYLITLWVPNFTYCQMKVWLVNDVLEQMSKEAVVVNLR